MKNNRKNRNIKYIREKNNLRLGKISYKIFGKVSNEFLKDPIAMEYLLKEMVNEGTNKLLKFYKLILRRIVIDFGYNDNDFIEDIQTIRIQLTNQ